MSEIERQSKPPIFEFCTVNQFLAKTSHPPRSLLGDMWLTGELAVMFAEAGCGKSVLAVQIADSIARGAAFKPIEAKPPRQKVVYLDLESAPEQFYSRYRGDDGGSRPYRFPANFVHARLGLVTDPTIEGVEELLAATDAKVMIIDNLAHLMKGHSSEEAARIMRELRRLCRRDGVSILLLVHAPPTSLRRGIEARDLPFAQVISAFADNVFAVGRVGAAASERYIKHLRPGPAAHVFGAAHVPWFRIRKRGKFTVFEFRGFARESALRLSHGDRREWQLIDRIAELKQLGMPVRSIAKALDMSKTTVQKYAVICQQPLASVRRQTEDLAPNGANELYDEIRESDVDGQDHFIERDLDRYWLRKGFEPLDAGDDIPVQDDAENDVCDDADGREILAATDRDGDEGTVPAEEVAPHPLLERDIDNNEREIWVEKRDERGRRLVWYLAQTSNGVPNGKYTRYEYRGLAGNYGQTVDHLPTGDPGRSPP